MREVGKCRLAICPKEEIGSVTIFNHSGSKNGIERMWYIYTMEYYSAIKKNEMMPFAATWMDLETVILSEVSQTEKIICYHICRI